MDFGKSTKIFCPLFVLLPNFWSRQIHITMVYTRHHSWLTPWKASCHDDSNTNKIVQMWIFIGIRKGTYNLLFDSRQFDFTQIAEPIAGISFTRIKRPIEPQLVGSTNNNKAWRVSQFPPFSNGPSNGRWRSAGMPVDLSWHEDDLERTKNLRIDCVFIHVFVQSSKLICLNWFEMNGTQQKNLIRPRTTGHAVTVET